MPFFSNEQAVIHSQETSITELLNAVRDQSDQINYQRGKIKNLEEKVDVRDCMKSVQEDCLFKCAHPDPVFPCDISKNKEENKIVTPHWCLPVYKEILCTIKYLLL